MIINVLENQKASDFVDIYSSKTIFEIVRKNRDFPDRVSEEKEKIGLLQAIKEGEQTSLVSRAEIFDLLENKN
jgi:ABC-type Fe3+-citrate transport system substrate-binding protein